MFSPCASASPEEVFRAALGAGLHGIAITEHDVEWPPQQILEIQRSSGADHLFLVIGQEVRAWENGEIAGDFLCFGFHRPVNHSLTPEELVEAVHAEGGIIVPAHPYRPGLGAGERILDLRVDAIEVFSTNSSPREQQLARITAEKMGLPQVAGSDAHQAHLVGAFLTAFQEEIKSEEDLIRAIRRGRCTPFVPPEG